MTAPVLGPLPGSPEGPLAPSTTAVVGPTIRTSGFAEDDGSAPRRLVAALEAYTDGEGGPADVIDALAGSRLLIPVVAVLDDEAAVGDDGLRREKTSHMATVSITGRDGRVGLLAFSGVDAMHRWDPAARPVPVSARRAAEAALADGADALVLDIAGPVTFAVEAADLRALAAGYRSPVDTGDIPVWAVAVGLATVEVDSVPSEADGHGTPHGARPASRLRVRRARWRDRR